MGNNEEGKSSKMEKSASPAPPDQTNIHVYPDWGAMQAYYGPRVALPPYYNSAVASGHAPHPYMWGPPQPMMSPYGAPYAAVYSHGGVYAHPAVPMGSHPHGPGVPPSPAAAAPPNNETPTKSSANSDAGLMKKLKGFDGLAMTIGNGNGNAECGENRPSESGETEGSSEGSDGNTATGKKRSRDSTSTNGGDVKNKTQANSRSSREVNSSSGKLMVASVAPDSISGKAVGSVISPGMALELRNHINAGVAKSSPPSAPQPCTVLPPPEAWLQGTQNDRELKRERRKQSNRESARRSRLRKQAETEELAQRVETLTAENVALKSEISRLTEKSEKLRNENAALMKLKNSQLGDAEDASLNNTDGQRAPSTENLLSRVNNSAADRSKEEEGEVYERNSKSGAKLHQLLDTSPRADAVAAG